MKIQIRRDRGSVKLFGDLPDTYILTLSPKGISRYAGVSTRSNLCLTEYNHFDGGLIEEQGCSGSSMTKVEE